jgi:hypothetical protein
MNTSHIILLLVLILIVFIMYYNVGKRDMTYVRSDIDNESYMVRDVRDKKQAANILARLKRNIYAITDYMYNKLNNHKIAQTQRYKEFKPYILQLKQKIKGVVVKESSANTVYTSYTINKGEQIIFCIRSKSITSVLTSNDIHDINLIMYVALHEISHVACPGYDHTPLFKKIFRFICEEAIEMGIYKRIDFVAHPKEYCGMKIHDTII